jgi:hypothetical protein
MEQNKMIIFGLVIGILLVLALFYGSNMGQAWVGLGRSPTAMPTQTLVTTPNRQIAQCGLNASQAEYTTSNYNYKGNGYTVEVVLIPDNANPATAKFKVNGETTDLLVVGQSYKLTDGVTIEVRAISQGIPVISKGNIDYVGFCLN